MIVQLAYSLDHVAKIKTVRVAVKEGGWPCTSPITRFAIPLRHICWKGGYDIRTVQELLGHEDLKTTMVYTHVLNRGGRGGKSPVDDLYRMPAC